MQSNPGGEKIAESVKKNWSGESFGFIPKPAECERREEDGDMPPAEKNQAMGKSKDHCRDEKGFSDGNSQKAVTIGKNLAHSSQEISAKKKLFGKGDQKKMKEKCIQERRIGKWLITKMKDINLKKMISDQNHRKNNERDKTGDFEGIEKITPIFFKKIDRFFFENKNQRRGINQKNARKNRQIVSDKRDKSRLE